MAGPGHQPKAVPVDGLGTCDLARGHFTAGHEERGHGVLSTGRLTPSTDGPRAEAAGQGPEEEAPAPVLSDRPVL